MAELRFGGGLNQQDDELVSFEECIDGENFLLDGDSRTFAPRPAFELQGTATNGSEVAGIMQLITRADVETTLIQAGLTVYNWDGASTFSDVATVATDSVLRDAYWSLDDLLIITDLNKNQAVSTWNGTTFAALSHNISGVTNLYAKYSVVFQGRVWLFNVTTDATANPHVILASEFENYDNFDNSFTPDSTTLTYSDPFFLTVPDLRPINGVATFFDTIVISTEDGRLFKLSGSDATDYSVDEFYAGSSAAGEEMIVNMGNDVFYVRTGGAIERLLASEQFGDTTADDISKWIQTEVSGLTSGIAVYDQARQRVCLFTGNKALVMDKHLLHSGADVHDAGPLSPWMKWTTQMASNLSVSAARYLRKPGGTTYTIFFGGPAGQIYDMNGTGASDAGSTLIKAYRKTRIINTLPSVDDITMGRITYRRRGACNMDMRFEWTDAYVTTLTRVPLKGTVTLTDSAYWADDVYFGGDVYWGGSTTSDDVVSTVGYSAVGKAPSFFLTTTINSAVNFAVYKVETE